MVDPTKIKDYLALKWGIADQQCFDRIRCYEKRSSTDSYLERLRNESKFQKNLPMIILAAVVFSEIIWVVFF